MVVTPRSKLRFQLYYGVKPTGRHHTILREGPLPPACPTCEGVGLLDIEGGEWYRICPSCLGWGKSLFPNTPELKALRERIRAVYPDAIMPDADEVAPETFQEFLMSGHTVVEDLARGVMVVLRGSPPPRRTGARGLRTRVRRALRSARDRWLRWVA